MRTPEAKEKDRIRAYLKAIGAFRVSPVTMGWGQQTIDEFACIDGIFWGIEVKQPGKEPTKRQFWTLNQIKAAGGMTTWGHADRVILDIEKWRKQRTVK